MATPSAATSGACSATSKSRKLSPRTTAIAIGVVGVKRVLEVVVLGRSAAHPRSVWEIAAQALDRRADGLIGRVGRRDDLDQALAVGPGLGR